MFGHYFRNLRERKGLSLTEAAAQLGMSKSNLAKLETQSAFSGVRKFVQLCAYYQTNPAVMLNTTNSEYIAVHYSRAAAAPISHDNAIKTTALGQHPNQAAAEQYAMDLLKCSGRIGPVLKLTANTAVIVFTTTDYQTLLEQHNE